MRLDASALGPLVGIVVVIDVGEQKALRCLMDDDTDVAVDAHGPEVRVLRGIDPMKLKPWIGRIGLQIERRRFDRLLLVAREPAEGEREGIGDAKFHTCASLSSLPRLGV
ncbi:MAG TPA: hypothetical protein PK264_10995 [Hyphomicrobiaceae bacterium]|nr:hypothetical protein [Hyphomicrobiaceae bacterium]